MNTAFPENIFLPKREKSSIYNYRVESGKTIAKNKSILFCGICKNVEKTIELNIERLCNIGSNLKNFHIFIYENDSSDNTSSILKNINSKYITAVSEKIGEFDYRENLTNGLDPWHYNRCKIIANHRNKYLEYAKLNKHYDYLCVIDLDLLGGWSLDGFFHGLFSIESMDNIACVSSYGVLTECTNNKLMEEVSCGRYLMYDSLAYRPLSISRGVHMCRLPLFNKLVFQRGQDPVLVNSNFGGMAIYKFNAIVNKKYYAKQWEEGFVDPDHVNINRDIIKDGYNIILDPSMICSHSKHIYCKDI
jgi:hypothetical protein